MPQDNAKLRDIPSSTSHPERLASDLGMFMKCLNLKDDLKSDLKSPSNRTPPRATPPRPMGLHPGHPLKGKFRAI